jgi:helicase
MQENMKIDQLEYFGIPHYMINIWKEHYSNSLLPVQEKAVRQFNLLQPDNQSLYQQSTRDRKRPENLLVISPSSSGKTLVGEMAALQEIAFQKKVILLVPLRILAEEKYQHFVQLYHSIGLNVKLSSRDHRHDDQDIIKGNFHIAIIVYEKFYYLLLQYPECISNVSLIIADEIQLINDRQRGPRLESSFNYLKNNYPDIRIIALSAFTEYLFHLTSWLDALLLLSTYRPIELRKGIVRNGIYRYIEHNSKMIGEEIFFPEEDVQECNLASYLKATLQFLINQNESSLIFFSTKNEVRLWSGWLKTQFCLNPARTAMAQLQALEDSTSKEELMNLFQNGISYHCADLSWQERRAIEEAVRLGELKIVCATSTLAMGVNLPVNNVILTGQKIISNQNSSSGLSNYYKKALTFSEVENMGGRAGRLKSGNSFGRIIFLAPSLIELTAYQRLYFRESPKDLSILYLSYYPAIQQVNKQKQNNDNIQIRENVINDNHYPAETDITNLAIINPSFPEIAKENPVIIQQDILTFLLYRIALEGQSLEDIYQMLQTGKYARGQAFWLYQFSQKYSESDIIANLKQLIAFGLIAMPTGKDYQITELGQLVTSRGISFQTYIHFLKWISQNQKEDSSELEILFLIATSNDGASYFIDYPGRGKRIAKNKKSPIQKWKEYLRLRMLNLIFEQQEGGKTIFQNNLNINLLQNSKQNFKNGVNNYLAIKNTLLMYDWITGKELKDMEEDYGILGGCIQKIGEGFSWLADTLAAIAQKEGWKEERPDDLEKIKQLSARLISGVEPEGLALARLQIPGLTRGYIQRLVQEGYNNENCLRELSENQLQLLLPDLLIQKIKKNLTLKSDSKSEFFGKISKPDPLLDYKNRQNQQQQFNRNYQKSIKNKLKTAIAINLNRPDRIFFLGEEITVNKISFQLILLLAKNKGKVVLYEQIIDTLWPADEDATYHRLWYHLAKLRNNMQKVIQEKNKNSLNLANNYPKEKLLKVIPGRGLLFDSNVLIEWSE